MSEAGMLDHKRGHRRIAPRCPWCAHELHPDDFDMRDINELVALFYNAGPPEQGPRVGIRKGDVLLVSRVGEPVRFRPAALKCALCGKSFAAPLERFEVCRGKLVHVDCDIHLSRRHHDHGAGQGKARPSLEAR